MTLAVVTNEAQNGAIGSDALWPALREAARPAVANIARLVGAARTSGIAVIHVLSVKRPDLRGSNNNAPLFRAARRAGGFAAQLVPELGPEPTDIIIEKVAGMSPLRVTDLDPILRNLGVGTIVLAGVSLNVAIPSITFDAVNRGYRVVIPRDAVAGVPVEYGEQVLLHTMSLVADITTVDELIVSPAFMRRSR